MSGADHASRLIGVLLGVSVALTGCSAAEPLPDVPRLGVRPIAPGEVGVLPDSGPLQFRAGFVLSSDDPRFGGFSGVWLAPDGAELLVVSDRPSFWRFRLHTDPAGRLFDVEPIGVRVPSDTGSSWDAEALAPLPDGVIAVAHEGDNRVEHRSLDGLDLLATSPLPAVLDAERNTGVEALATLPDGRLLALSEGIRGDDGDVLGWILDGDRAEQLTYVASGGFVPTGATVLAGDLFVVERSFSLVQGGFAARVVALPVDDVRPRARLEGRQLIRLGPNFSDNFEAIEAREAPGGGPILLYLMTDDNQTPLQRSLLLQFAIERQDLAQAVAGTG